MGRDTPSAAAVSGMDKVSLSVVVTVFKYYASFSEILLHHVAVWPDCLPGGPIGCPSFLEYRFTLYHAGNVALAQFSTAALILHLPKLKVFTYSKLKDCNMRENSGKIYLYEYILPLTWSGGYAMIAL